MRRRSWLLVSFLFLLKAFVAPVNPAASAGGAVPRLGV